MTKPKATKKPSAASSVLPPASGSLGLPELYRQMNANDGAPGDGKSKASGRSAVEPLDVDVTALFVDAVGYSKHTELVMPRRALDELHRVFDIVREEVRLRGGVVDRSLGDGLLCVFGVGADGNDPSSSHAEAALATAMAVQRASAKLIVDGAALAIPLRIGLNSGRVLLCDLGDEDRRDVTIIGNAVNLAKRLESAAEPFSIIIGQETNARLRAEVRSDLLPILRIVQLKRHEGLLEAYECDAFRGEGDLRRRATDVYRKQIGVERRAMRHRVTADRPIIVTLDLNGGRIARGTLIDFSPDGFALDVDTFLGRGVVTFLSMDTPDGKLASELRRWGVLPLSVEVRWGVPSRTGYLHGVEIFSLNGTQRGILYAGLRSLMGDTAARRHQIPPDVNLTFGTTFGPARITDFSFDGLGLEFDQDLEIGSKFQVFLEDRRPEGAQITVAEVAVRRRDFQHGQRVYGVTFTELASEERSHWYTVLITYCSIPVP